MEFVRVEGERFFAGDQPYQPVGVNLWYGVNLASAGPGGDRERLGRELERLERLGVNNLRVLAGSEGPASAPYRLAPPLQPERGRYDQALLEGLDLLIWEAERRGMRLVLCLTNFWFWSGGMAQYLAWNGAGPIPYPESPGGSWLAFQRYSARFYDNPGARADFERFVEALVGRRNRRTGRRYHDEPAIMAWELANEPRGMTHAAAMRRWIDQTAGLIRSLDRRHLITTGSEGDTNFAAFHGVDFIADHSCGEIDYATAHLWVENWGWYEPSELASWPRAQKRALEYIRRHRQGAEALGKPLVLEEFGLARDRGSHDPRASVDRRDEYFAMILGEVAASVEAGGPLRGANLWAWAGEGRPRRPAGRRWNPGDPWTGDPPHEPQGWYGIYDHDRSTAAVLARLAALLGGSDR